MAVLEFQKREIEQKAMATNRDFVSLEREPGAVRHRLGAMRRAGYHTDEVD